MVCGENIMIHCGQAGCQAGLECWELFCLEHGIYPDGTLATEFGHQREKATAQTRPFFVETLPEKYVPRAVFFDLDPNVIFDMRTGAYQSLFSRDLLVAGNGDASNNFARGFYTLGLEFIETMMDKIRRMSEATDKMDCFMLMRSNCGGTGGGFGSLLLNKLDEDFEKVCKLSVEINPSDNTATSPMEIYNSVLCNHASIDHTHCTYLVENERMYNLFGRFLGAKCVDYKNLNQLIAQLFSGLTASFRFAGSMNATPSELQTNVAPFPRIHFPLLTFGPLIPHENLHSSFTSVDALTRLAFEPKNQMLTCNPRDGKYVAACLLYRGVVEMNDCCAALAKFKASKSQNSRNQFVDWCPTGHKVAINNSLPLTVPGSLMSCTCRNITGIMNSTSVEQVWRRILAKFDSMYNKKAYFHWFEAEGVTVEEITEARGNLDSLVVDYNDIKIK